LNFTAWNKANASKGGKIGGQVTKERLSVSSERQHEIKTLYDGFDKSWGWLNKFAAALGVSHTQARRLITKYAGVS
jgi:hypothetical protein